MYLYLYHGVNKGPWRDGAEQDRTAFSEGLVRKALRDYAARPGRKISGLVPEEAVIARGGTGKPYFTGLPEPDGKGAPAVHYSVSHSGDWWGCLMAEEPVGFDMEVCREKINYEKIARRYFTEEEYKLILSAGLDVFFDVWVRKEAYVKYLGTGLSEGLDRFSVAEGGKLSPRVILLDEAIRRPSCFVRPCEVRDGMKAAYCSAGGNPVRAVIPL